MISPEEYRNAGSIGKGLRPLERSKFSANDSGEIATSFSGIRRFLTNSDLFLLLRVDNQIAVICLLQQIDGGRRHFLRHQHLSCCQPVHG